MGRPPITISEAQKAEIVTLAAVLNAGQIADYFGIGRTTFYALMKRDPTILEQYKKGKARAIGSIAQGLISKARAGDTTSMIFFLKTQAGWRERGPIEDLEVDLEDPPLPGRLDLRKLSDDALLELLQAVGDHEANSGRVEDLVVTCIPAWPRPPR